MKGTRLAKPVLSLGLVCLAFLTGLNRVAEYRNHWSDVVAGFLIGSAIATFLVSILALNGCQGPCMCVWNREPEHGGELLRCPVRSAGSQAWGQIWHTWPAWS